MESHLQRRIVRGLRKEFPYSFWRKIHVGEFQSAGIPDLLGSVEGYTFLFEVKPIGENPKPIQVKVMKQARKSGACSCVVRSPEEAIRVVHHVLAVRGVLRRPERSWIMRFISRFT